MTENTEWAWGFRGVSLIDDHLLWYDKIGTVAYAGGGAGEQSFADFLANGPRLSGMPADALAELTAAVEKRAAPGG